MNDIIVIAIGGNAIELALTKENYWDKIKNIKIISEQIVKLIKKNFRIVITHGNGPQIGNLLIQQEISSKEIPVQPLHVLSAMTQAQIGYLLQQELYNLLNKKFNVVTLVTQVLVNKNDEDFKNPTKPIGPLYDEKEAEKIIKERNYLMKKVKVRNKEGYRRVVPSPEPIDIIEKDIIKKLLNENTIVIACGGGGIPVTLNDGKIQGIDAVIDKDLTSAKLAEIIKASIFLIVTNVEKVKLNFGKPNEKEINEINVEKAKMYLKEGHFQEGSMKPKIISCIRFLEKGGKLAIITSLDKIVEAIEGKAGTRIFKN